MTPAFAPRQDVLASALAAINQAFGPGSDTRALKCHCRRVLRFPDHPRWKARYGRRAAHVAEAIICWRASNDLATRCAGIPPRSAPCLHIAINIIERQYRDEKRAVQIAAALGRGNGLSVAVLRELRLLLRFLRAAGMAREFPKLLAEFAS